MSMNCRSPGGICNQNAMQNIAKQYGYLGLVGSQSCGVGGKLLRVISDQSHEKLLLNDVVMGKKH